MKSLAASCLLLTFASVAVADPTDDVRCREIAFSKSVETRDLERFRSFIDGDARFVSDKVRRGPDVIAEAWAPFLAEAGPRIKWRPQYVEVLEDGTLALSRGPYRMVVTDEDGAETEHWGTFVSVWRLDADGAWRIVFDAGSPAAGPPAEEIRALLDAGDACET